MEKRDIIHLKFLNIVDSIISILSLGNVLPFFKLKFGPLGKECSKDFPYFRFTNLSANQKAWNLLGDIVCIFDSIIFILTVGKIDTNWTLKYAIFKLKRYVTNN